MTSPISTERLKEILGLIAKATPGPWIIERGEGEPHINASYPIKGHPDAVVSVAFDLREAELAYFMAFQPEVAASIISELLAAWEALRPFAEFDGFNDDCPDDTPAWYYPTDEIDQPSEVTVGDFRRARALSGNRRGE